MLGLPFGLVLGAALLLYTHWKTIWPEMQQDRRWKASFIIRDVLKPIADGFLGMALDVVSAAATAFGWVPCIAAANWRWLPVTPSRPSSPRRTPTWNGWASSAKAVGGAGRGEHGLRVGGGDPGVDARREDGVGADHRRGRPPDAHHGRELRTRCMLSDDPDRRSPRHGDHRRDSETAGGGDESGRGVHVGDVRVVLRCSAGSAGASGGLSSIQALGQQMAAAYGWTGADAGQP